MRVVALAIPLMPTCEVLLPPDWEPCGANARSGNDIPLGIVSSVMCCPDCAIEIFGKAEDGSSLCADCGKKTGKRTVRCTKCAKQRRYRRSGRAARLTIRRAKSSHREREG